MIYRVAERAGGGWLGAAEGIRLGGGLEATEAIARCFFDFFIEVPRRLLCFEAVSGDQFSLIDLTASAGAEQISDTKSDFVRYHVTFLTMG